MRFGVSPILTRQLCAAMFAASAHLLLAMVMALGLLQSVPKPKSATNHKPTTLHIDALHIDALHIDALHIELRTTASVPGNSPKQNTEPPPTVVSTVAPTVAGNIIDTITAALAAKPAATTQDNPTPENTPAIDIPYYYSLKQLSKKPVVVSDDTASIQLFLPGNETQIVILLLLINENGAIDSVEVEQSNLNEELIAIITSEYGKKLRFSPGEIDGLAVKCQLKIQVMLENTNTPALQR
jgi:hypothetical protein